MTLDEVVEELVAARRDVVRISDERERAATLLADAGTLARAKERVAAAEASLAAYVNARVEEPIP